MLSSRNVRSLVEVCDADMFDSDAGNGRDLEFDAHGRPSDIFGEAFDLFDALFVVQEVVFDPSIIFT